MSTGNFLCKDAATPLCEDYAAAGAVCSFSTNCEALLEAARESFLPVEASPVSPDFSVRFWVDHNNAPKPPWPKPYVRGLKHLVFAGFDSESSMLADLRTRRVIGRFSAAMAADRSYWKTVIFPILLTIVGASVGVAELHCSCVAKKQNGLLLVGPGRSGKSTLAVALAQVGFGFLSDDRTFCSWRNGKLLAWGLATTLKLRSDAGAHFKELQGRRPTDLQNGEPSFRLDPEFGLGVERVKRCEPRLLVFLERSESQKFCLIRMSAEEAAARLEEDLVAEMPDAVANQTEVVRKLTELPCRLLRYGGPPQDVAHELSMYFDRAQSPVLTPVAADGIEITTNSECENPSARPKRPDLLRRFTPTPYFADLRIMARTVRLETNNPRVLQLGEDFFKQYQLGPSGSPDFAWRIVCEPHPQLSPSGVQISAFSDRNLRFVNIGQRSFLAVDLDRCEGIAFLGEHFVEGDPRFHGRPPLDILFCMSAGSLGLTTLSAACVGLGEMGVLLFGPPNSGKTTASYLATKLGLEFHADQTVFLETRTGKLRMWGDPFPAVFRPDTVRFLPELRDLARPSHYSGLTFYYMDKRPFQATQVRPITPVCSVFLDRMGATKCRVASVDSRELFRRLTESVLFKDDDRFQAQNSAVFRSLEKLPAYDLIYGEDPAMAATLVQRLLMDHEVSQSRHSVEV
jgi:hypothetical protein